jgi:hypothetical protein
MKTKTTSKGQPYNWSEQPRPKVTLVGVDGNAYSLMGAATVAMRRAGCTKKHIARVMDEAMSGDYNALIGTLAYYCEVS